MSLLESCAYGRRNREGEGSGEMEFEPVPYTFRVPEKYNKIGETSVQAPPRWLLIDHAVAVIWSLFKFSSTTKPLDIDDLKWTHEFLKDVRNVKGENPPDVKICLKEIQNRLISLYAQLTQPKEEVQIKEKESIQETVPLTRQKTNSITASKVPKKEFRFSKSDIKEPPKAPAKFETNITRKTSIREPRKFATPPKKAAVTATKSTPIPTKRSEIPRKEEKKKESKDQASVDNFFTEVFERNRKNDRVLGARHNEKLKEPGTMAEADSNQKMFQCDLGHKDPISNENGKISLQFKQWITEEESNNEEQAYRNLKNEIRNLMKNPKISKEEVMKFLSNWREEQVERLQSELKRLNSIEEFMKSLKMDGYVPYVHENLAQKLESEVYKKKTTDMKS